MFFDVFLASFSPVLANPPYVASLGFLGYWLYLYSLKAHHLNIQVPSLDWELGSSVVKVAYCRITAN